MKPPLRVILADPDTSFAGLVESALDGEPNINLVGRAVEGKEAVQLVFLHAPDVVFIAVEMPDAIEAARDILCQTPRPPKVILMCVEDLDAAALSATAGVSGYVRKTDGALRMVSLVAALAALTAGSAAPTNGSD